MKVLHHNNAYFVCAHEYWGICYFKDPQGNYYSYSPKKFTLSTSTVYNDFLIGLHWFEGDTFIIRTTEKKEIF